MKPAMIPRPGIVQKPHHMSYSGSSAASQPGSITHAAWQSTMEHHASSSRGGGGPNPQLVIPRAKVKPRSYQQSAAHGYNSDEEVSVFDRPSSLCFYTQYFVIWLEIVKNDCIKLFLCTLG